MQKRNLSECSWCIYDPHVLLIHFVSICYVRCSSTDTINGVVFAIFPVGTVLMSPFTFILLKYMGRLKVLLLGSVILSFGGIMFGVANKIYVFMIARFIQGIGQSLISYVAFE